MEPDRWLGVELRHLAALQAVAEEGSFGRAARRLGYTQSAVSQQIATLERVVGERLIERPGGPRAVSLTQGGEILLRHADAIVARLRAAQADLAALSAGGIGSLRVGAFQSVGARVLPEVMRRFGTRWPQVDISLTEAAHDDELLGLLERGDVDLAFVILPLSVGPFETIELLRDPYVLVVEAGSPLAEQATDELLRTLSELPLIGFRLCRSASQLEAGLRAHGIEPRIVFRSDHNGTVQGLVAAGVGSALIPRLAVESNDEAIEVLELGSEIPPRLIAIAWHRDRYQAPATRAFVETAQEVCEGVARSLAAEPAAAG
jgi:molybdate transport repressor ModE-like protein